MGRKRAGRILVLWSYHRGETPPRAARLGVVVSRRDGPAAQRNLFKRRMREIFRLNKSRLARGWDLVLAPKAGTPFPATFEELRADFLELAGKIRNDA